MSNQDPKNCRDNKAKRELLIESMEPRVLFDAVPIAPVDLVDSPVDPLIDIPAHQMTVSDAGNQQEDQQTAVKHVLFVDKSVDGFETLTEEFLAGQDADVYLINGSSDGLEQIEKHLGKYSNLDSIHIISHGESGQLHLGNETIDGSSLVDQHATTLVRIGQSLSSSGDILLYGCDLASTPDGQDFVETLGRMTGADVAASDDLTGNDSFGGDWDLEFRAGEIETEVGVSETARSTYLGVLAPVSVDIGIAYDGTPTFDADDAAGNDSSPNNGIVRVHDTVGFNFFYNTNSDGATNPILKSLLPQGMKWTAVPPQALGPTTGIYDGAAYELDGSLVAGGDGRLMVAHLLDIPGTTSSKITPIATVLGVPNETLFSDLTVEFESDEIAGSPLESAGVELIASASANANIRMQQARYRGIHSNEDGTQQGAVYQIDINVIGGHATRTGSDAIKGAAELEDNLNFDLNVSAFGDNSRLFNWIPDGETHNNYFGGDGATRNFEYVNGTLSWYNWNAPGGRAGEYARLGPNQATVDSGDWTASQAASGDLINVSIAGADTTGANFPEYDARTWIDNPLPAGEKFFIAGQVFVWIPLDDIEAGNDGTIGTADDGNRSLTIDIEGFDPNDAQGLTNNYGAGDEPTSDNSRTFTAVTSGSPGQTSYFREAGTWGIPPTATNYYAGDGGAVIGQTIDHVSRLGTNSGLTELDDVVLSGFFDNSAFRIVDNAMPASQRPDVGGGTYDWAMLRMTDSNRVTTYLTQGEDYVIEFGTGGQGGDAAFDDWAEMSSATADDTDTSTVWTSDPTDIAALGGTADPDTGVSDAITKYRFRMLKPVPSGAYLYGFVTLEVKDFSSLNLGAGNTDGRTLAVFGGQNNENRANWELSGYDPEDHSGDIYDGDRLTLTDAKVRIDMTVEEAVPGSGNVFLAGTPATFVLDGTVTAPILTGAPAQDVVVENMLPGGMFINDPSSATPLAPNGNPVEWFDGTSWSIDFPTSGKAYGIRWDFGDVPLGTTLEQMRYDAIIPFDAPDTTPFTNTATISSPSDHTPGTLARTTSAGIIAIQSSSVNGSEISTTPLVGTDTPIEFTLQIANVSDTPSDTIDVVAILPFNGDIIGSNFQGVFTAINSNNLPPGIDVYVTTADQATLDAADGFDDGNGDPGVSGDAWYVAAGTGIWSGTLADVGTTINAEDVTAIRFVSNGSVDPILPAQSSLEFNVGLTPLGNQGLPAPDFYHMQFVARVDSGVLPLPVYSPVATAKVVEAGIEIQTEVMQDPSGTNIDPANDAHWGETVTVTESSVVYYRVQVTNTGTSILKNASATDFIPPGTTYVAGSAVGDGDVSDFENGWSLGLGPGDTKTVVYAVQVNPTSETAYTHTSSVEATDDSGQYVSDSDPAGFESNLNPDATDDAYATDEDTIVSGQLLDGSGGGTDTDPGGDLLSTVAINGNAVANGSQYTLPSGAVVTLNSDGTFDYDPNGAFDGLTTGAPVQDTFTYTVDDGEGGSDVATVTVDITGANDAPVIDHGFASIDFGFNGNHKKTTTSKSSYVGDQNFVVDTSASYELSVTAFAGDGAGGEYDLASRHYMGFVSYDIDGKIIGMYHYSKVAGSTDTTLAVDLKPGDTQIVLNDATGWNDGGTGHLRTLAWYGYADSTGNVYDDYTYTRNYQADLWDAGAISGNVITLRNPWTGPALDAGDAVRNARSGGSYQYNLASYQHIGETPEDFSDTIGGGEITSGAYEYSLFRPGTHSISALVLADYTNTGTDLTVCNFELREIGTPEADGVTTFTENGGPIDIVDGDASITDVDDSNMEALTITLTNGMIGDTLHVDEAAINALGISVSGIPTGPLTANGPITLTLTADNVDVVSKADFVEAMKQIQFENLTDDPDPTDRVIEFQTNDGENDSNLDPLLIKIVQLNDPPIVDNTAITVPEGSQNYMLGLTRPTDVDSADTLTITVTGLPTLGAVTLANGTPVTNGMVLTETELEGLRFDSPADYDGVTDPGDFTYDVTDGTTTVSGYTDITILEINDAPQANDDMFTVDEDGSVIIDVLDDDTDPENDSLTVTHVDGQAIAVGGSVTVANGTVVLNADGTLSFTPDADYEGSVDFKYTISDRVSTTGEAGHSLYLESTNDNGSLIFDINLETGEKTFIGESPFGSSTAMAYDEATGYAYFIRANGDVYAWQNGTDLSTATLIADVENPAAGWTDTVPNAESHQTGAMYNGSLYIVPTDRAPTDDALYRIDFSDPTTVSDVVKVANMSGDTYGWNNNDDIIIDQATGILYGRGDTNDRANNQRSSYFYSYDLNTGVFTMLAESTYAHDYNNSANNPTDRGDFRDVNTGMSVGQDGIIYGTDGSGRIVQLNLDGTTVEVAQFPIHDDDGFAGGDLASSTLHGAISIACVSGNVVAVNDAPVNVGTIPDQNDVDSVAISNVDVTSFFNDIDGDVLTFDDAGSLPPGLSIDPNTGIISGTPDSDASVDGPYTVTIITEDPDGETSTQTFVWNVTNPGPNATDNDLGTTESGSLVGNVMTDDDGNGLDSDVDGDTISVVEVNGSAANMSTAVAGTNGGEFSVNADGSYDFDTNGDFEDLAVGESRTTSITYTISDGQGGTDTATVEVTITGQNDNPNTVGTIPTQNDVDSVVVSNLDVSGFFGDTDTTDVLTFDDGGTLPPGLSIDPNTGVISGTPDADASVGGPYTVEITADDGNGGTVVQTFVWNVTNPGPDATDNDLGTTENAAVTGNVMSDNDGSGIDSDADGDTITVVSVNGSAANMSTAVTGTNGGEFTVNVDGSYDFQPGTDFDDLAVGETRDTAITYTISDGEGGFDSATVTITVTGVNDNPNTVGTIPTQNDVDSVVVSNLDVSGFFGDTDTTDVLTFDDGGTLPPGLSIDPNTGVISGTPDADASVGGPYTVEITADDGNGGTVVQAFVWNVTNPGPEATDNQYSTTENNSVVGNAMGDNTGSGIDSDIDGDAIVVGGVNGLNGNLAMPITGSNGGEFSVDSDGAFSFDPGSDFDDLAVGETRTTNVTYSITDGQGGTDTATIEVVVTGTNDAPRTVGSIADQSSSDSETIAPLDVTSLFGDTDTTDVLTYIGGGTLPPGLSLDPATGIISGTISADASTTGPYSVSITAVDPSGSTTTQAFVWNVANPAPVAGDTLDHTDEDTTHLIDLLELTSDPDGDTISVTQINGVDISVGQTIELPSGALLTLNPDGTATYDPNGVYEGLEEAEMTIDTFNFTVDDGEGGVVQAKAVVTIIGVNDAPVALGESVTTGLDVPISVEVLANESDVDGQPLSVMIVGQPNDGTAIVNPDGTITYTPNAGFFGTQTVDYLVEDPDGGTARATLVVEVEPQFAFDSFTNLSKSHEAKAESNPTNLRLLSREIYTLSPEPIFSGFAQPGTQIVGRIYDQSGHLVAESTALTDPGGNWMMQMGTGIHEQYRIEFEQVAGTQDVYGYLGLNPGGNSYQSMQPATQYDQPMSVENAFKSSAFASLQEIHEANNNFGGMVNSSTVDN